MIIPTFLKWVGGKRKILDKLDKNLPQKFNNYYEPFLGGGSVFFYMKQKFPNKKFVISDINQDLINAYIDVRDNPAQLVKKLKYFKKNNSEKFYYLVRKKFNEGKFKGVDRSASFIYLNKTCFNGIYRVNSKNEFNVPYGRHKDPKIFEEEIILFASKLLAGVEILCCDYEPLKNRIKKHDFVYLDPCYDPLKKTSFANYTSTKFSNEDNERMSLFVAEIKRREAYILFSNNLTSHVKSLYLKEKGFIWIEISSFRSVGSKGQYRGRIPELLIKNYSS